METNPYAVRRSHTSLMNGSGHQDNEDCCYIGLWLLRTSTNPILHFKFHVKHSLRIYIEFQITSKP